MAANPNATIGELAARFLRKNGHQSVMWGDVMLLHEIAAAAGIEPNGSVTERKVLNAIDRSGAMVKLYTKVRIRNRERLVRCFYLPEHVPAEFKDKRATDPMQVSRVNRT